MLGEDHAAFGREMFERGSDVADVPAEEIVTRDAKDYAVDGGSLCIAQVETVGPTLLERRAELLDAVAAARERRGCALYALMVTDILSKSTRLLAAGDLGIVERAFGASPDGDGLELEGVMSRKKQVAPKLMAAA